MARRLPEEMKGRELIPLCFATRPREAEQIESVLDSATVDYTFEIRPLARTSIFSILFGSSKDGVVFLVPSEQFDFCLNLLDKKGLSHLIIN